MGEQLNFTIVDDCLTVYVSGKSVDLEKESHPKLYEEALNAIRENNHETLFDIVTRKLDSAQEVSDYSNDNFEVRNGVLYLKGEYTPIPPHIAMRVKQFMDLSLPYMPLVNFWKNIRENPSQISYEGLLRFLEHNKQPITDDGCFIGYKKVRKREVSENVKTPEGVTIHEKDGKKVYYVDTHSGSFDNGPGAKPVMDRFHIDPNPNVTCSQGLHVAAWNYAVGFGGNTVMSVKVNPRDVVAVPTDYNNQKIRTCGYEVIEECEVPILEEYVSDDDNYYRYMDVSELERLETEQLELIENLQQELDKFPGLSSDERQDLRDQIKDIEEDLAGIQRELAFRYDNDDEEEDDYRGDWGDEPEDDYRGDWGDEPEDEPNGPVVTSSLQEALRDSRTDW